MRALGIFFGRWLLGGVVLGLLVGCGFALRGAEGVPGEVLIRVEDRDLGGRVAEVLREYGVRVVRVRGDGGDSEGGEDWGGGALVRITESKFAQKLLTTDARGRGSGYSLHYEVVFGIGDGGLRSLSLGRDYRYAAGRQLSVEAEVEFLKDDLRREAAEGIVRYLIATID